MNEIGKQAPGESRADTGTQRPDMRDWEEQLNALLDGELDDAGAEQLQARAQNYTELATAIIEAYRLQQMMASLPVERAPDSLRRKLQAIPRERALARRARPGWWQRLDWLQPRWVMATAAVPLAVLLVVNTTGPREPGPEEIAKARQEMALAMSYLGRAGRQAGLAIGASLDEGMAEPVTKTTIDTLSEQMDLDKEQET